LEKIDPSIGCGVAVVFDGDSEDDSLVLIVEFFADRDKVSVKGLAAIFLSLK
jgi:sulfur transfer protein SufE